MIHKIKAVILAGGAGSRLQSLYPNISKMMVPINGKPFLEYLLEHLRKKGIKEIVLCVSYLREQIINYFGDGRKFGVDIEYSIEERQLGTGGAIKNAITKLESPDYFLVLNGDTLAEWDLRKILEVFIRKKADMAMIVTPTFSPDCSLLILDDKGKITRYIEKPNKFSFKANDQNFSGAGIYVMMRDLVKQWPEGNCSLEYDCIPKIVDRGRAYAVVTESKIYDIGVPDKLEVFSKFISGSYKKYFVTDQVES